LQIFVIGPFLVLLSLAEIDIIQGWMMLLDEYMELTKAMV
jgi:hypothetical protein